MNKSSVVTVYAKRGIFTRSKGTDANLSDTCETLEMKCAYLSTHVSERRIQIGTEAKKSWPGMHLGEQELILQEETKIAQQHLVQWQSLRQALYAA